MTGRFPVAVVAVMAYAVVVAVAEADALPPGATPVSGTAPFVQVGSDYAVQLPVDIPEGQQFVLTDVAIPTLRYAGFLIQVFAPDDLVNPRFEGSSGGAVGSSGGYFLYANSFQTGLVFSGAPTVTLPSCNYQCFGPSWRVSFSGYLKSAL